MSMAGAPLELDWPSACLQLARNARPLREVFHAGKGLARPYW